MSSTDDFDSSGGYVPTVVRVFVNITHTDTTSLYMHIATRTLVSIHFRKNESPGKVIMLCKKLRYTMVNRERQWLPLKAVCRYTTSSNSLKRIKSTGLPPQRPLTSIPSLPPKSTERFQEMKSGKQVQDCFTDRCYMFQFQNFKPARFR